MKNILLIALLIVLTSPYILAQKNNRFDSTYARKHELSIALGGNMNAGTFPSGSYYGGHGPSLSIGYAKVYKFNHFLRTGIELNVLSDYQSPHYYFPSNPSMSDPNPDNYTTYKYQVYTNNSNFLSNAYVGYEYGVGLRRFRFTFGVDLGLGFIQRKIDMREDFLTENRTYDPVTNLYNYNIQFNHTGHIQSTSRHIFASITPRLGIRRELGKRIALAFTFTPRIGFSQALQMDDQLNGVMPTSFRNPKSAWFYNQSAELRLIVKLGKRN